MVVLATQTPFTRVLRHVAFPRPRLLTPRIAVEVRDDIDEFAASYGVVHDMAMRAHPHRAFRNGNVARHLASGRQPRQQIQPVNRGASGPTRLLRTTE